MHDPCQRCDDDEDERIMRVETARSTAVIVDPLSEVDEFETTKSDEC